MGIITHVHNTYSHFVIQRNTRKHVQRHKIAEQKYVTGLAVLPRMYNRNRPGENGAPAEFVNISDNEQQIRDLIFDKYSVDHYVAERISLHRKVGEHRHPECLQVTYDMNELANLKTTVIIGKLIHIVLKLLPSHMTLTVILYLAAYNEGWATLMRTVYNILHTTPDVLLQYSI